MIDRGIRGRCESTRRERRVSRSPGERRKTAIFDLDNSYSVTFAADAVSDRLLIQNGQVDLEIGPNMYELTAPLPIKG